jgi:hypothetical protein
MINIDFFYQSFGASRPISPDEQLMIADGIRVACDGSQWTLMLEQGIQTEDRLEALFACARQIQRVIPFSTRSGWLAIRSPSLEPEDETSAAVNRLRQVMEKLGISNGLNS